jgi:hypothetical protein
LLSSTTPSIARVRNLRAGLKPQLCRYATTKPAPMGITHLHSTSTVGGRHAYAQGTMYKVQLIMPTVDSRPAPCANVGEGNDGVEEAAAVLMHVHGRHQNGHCQNTSKHLDVPCGAGASTLYICSVTWCGESCSGVKVNTFDHPPPHTHKHPKVAVTAQVYRRSSHPSQHHSQPWTACNSCCVCHLSESAVHAAAALFPSLYCSSLVCTPEWDCCLTKHQASGATTAQVQVLHSTYSDGRG